MKNSIIIALALSNLITLAIAYFAAKKYHVFVASRKNNQQLDLTKLHFSRIGEHGYLSIDDLKATYRGTYRDGVFCIDAVQEGKPLQLTKFKLLRLKFNASIWRARVA
jgi:hypothetical protein